MEASYRKNRSINTLVQSIQKTLDEASNNGLFEAWWTIPISFVERKLYYMLTPIIDNYKKKGYQVDYWDSKEYDATMLYFNWFDI